MAGVALESCEGAAELAEELIEGAGWPVQLAHAGYVHRMKQTPDKSDFTDARVLADLVRVGYLPEVWLPPPGVRELRRWTRAWLRWFEQAPLSEQSRLIIEDQLEDLKALERRLAKVEGRLTSLSEGDPIVRKLLAEPGIGPVTAWTLRAEVGRFARFPSGKHLSRFCGVSPRNASTGARQADAGLIKAGNPQLRATLIEVAHPLIRLQPRWRKLAARLADRASRAASWRRRWRTVGCGGFIIRCNPSDWRPSSGRVHGESHPPRLAVTRSFGPWALGSFL